MPPQSNASSTGCANCNTISHKLRNVEEARKKSSYIELKAIALGLESFETTKWYTDNQGVSRIVEVGKTCSVLCYIFSVCLLGNIKLEVEWTLRAANDRANFLSTIFDYTCIRSSGLPVGSHGIVGRRVQKSGHQLAASPHWITSSGITSNYTCRNI